MKRLKESSVLDVFNATAALRGQANAAVLMPGFSVAPLTATEVAHLASDDANRLPAPAAPSPSPAAVASGVTLLRGALDLANASGGDVARPGGVRA